MEVVEVAILMVRNLIRKQEDHAARCQEYRN
jgi:hypothetical protein